MAHIGFRGSTPHNGNSNGKANETCNGSYLLGVSREYGNRLYRG